MKLYCPSCKQFVVKVAFGIACGCTILAGHAEEKFPRKWTPDPTQQMRIEIASASTAVASVSTFADILRWPATKKNNST